MRKFLRFLLWVAVLVGLIVGLARLTALRWWRVPSDDPYLEASIAPTLRGGDLVLIWRLTKPKFGDLVVCPEPEASHRVVIARIAGEAGDRVTVQGSTVSVNGVKAPTEHACTPARFQVVHPGTGKAIEQSCDVEVLGNTTHERGGTGSHPVQPAPVDTAVDPGKVFLLSDNRLLPYDSRDFGLADRASCGESVVFRLVGAKGYSDEARRFVFIR
jgi:signal peptidase I